MLQIISSAWLLLKPVFAVNAIHRFIWMLHCRPTLFRFLLGVFFQFVLVRHTFLYSKHSFQSASFFPRHHLPIAFHVFSTILSGTCATRVAPGIISFAYFLSLSLRKYSYQHSHITRAYPCCLTVCCLPRSCLTKHVWTDHGLYTPSLQSHLNLPLAQHSMHFISAKFSKLH